MKTIGVLVGKTSLIEGGRVKYGFYPDYYSHSRHICMYSTLGTYVSHEVQTGVARVRLVKLISNK